MDEFDLIETYFAPLAARMPGAAGLTDDVAIFQPRAGFELVITTDSLVEGVHFLSDDPPGDIAAKSLRVNLSDLASAGAAPRAYTLALALSSRLDEVWVAEFTRGLALDQDHFDVGLIGGDTVSTPGPLTLTVTAFGEVPEGRALRRSGAQAGDRLFLSGAIGGGALGLACLTEDLALGDPARDAAVERYRRPTPRIDLGLALGGVATAAADVSDGLVADVGNICRASGCSAVLDLARIPFFVGSDALDRARLLTGGDDYELVFAVPAGTDSGEIEQLARVSRTEITEVGHLEDPTPDGPVTVLDGGSPLVLTRTGYRHD